MAQQITDSNFEELLSKKSLVIVDFGASWCGPCRMMAPIIDELADTYADRALICKADVEEAVDMADKYGIRSVPTILFFKDGQLIDTKFVGAVPKAKLVEAIEAAL